jgi:hypothetical protein
LEVSGNLANSRAFGGVVLLVGSCFWWGRAFGGEFGYGVSAKRGRGGLCSESFLGERDEADFASDCTLIEISIDSNFPVRALSPCLSTVILRFPPALIIFACFG